MDVEHLKIVLGFDLSKLFKDLKRVYAELDRLQQRIQRIPDVRISAQLDVGEGETQRLQQRLNAINEQMRFRLTPNIAIRREQLRTEWEELVTTTRLYLEPRVSLSRRQLTQEFAATEHGVRPTLDARVDFDLARLRTKIEALEQLRVRFPARLNTAGAIAQFHALSSVLYAWGVNIPVRFRYARSLASLYATIAAIEATSVRIPVRFPMAAGQAALFSGIQQNIQGREIGIPINFNAASDVGRRLLEGGLSGEDINVNIKGKALRAITDGGVSGRGGMRQNRSAKHRTGDHGLLTSRASKSPLVDLFNLRMADVKNIQAKALPAIWALGAAMPVVVSAVTAMGAAAYSAAASLGAIAGLGLLGTASARQGGGMPSMENLTEVFEGVMESAWEAFEPLATRLAPDVERGIDVLDVFFMRLAEAADVIMEMRPAARDFGRWAMSTVPQLLENFLLLGVAFEDIFRMIGREIDVDDMFQRLATFAGEALPYVNQFVVALRSLLPVILNAALGFLQVTATVANMASRLGNLLGMFPRFTRVMSVAVATGMVLYSVIALLNTSFAVLAGKTLVAAGQAVWMVVAAMRAKGGTLTVLNFKLAMFKAKLLTATGGVLVLTKAILGLLAITGIGLLVAGVSYLASQWLFASDAIDDATNSLKAFDSQSRQMQGSGVYDAPEAPDVGQGQGPVKIGPSSSSAGDVHYHAGADPEESSRVTNKHNFVQGRQAGH